MTTKNESLAGLSGIVKSRKIENNTFEIYFEDGRKVIRLHKTNVVTFMPNGNIILNSGGWMTPTTKDRINQYGFWGSWGITQTKGVWYMPDGSLFYDGIVIDNKGNVISEKLFDDLKEQKELKKKIRNFVNLLTKDNLPLPESGDCFYCSLRTDDGKTMGDNFNDNGHLMSHIEEGYLHGNLLYNAMKAKGYRNEGIAIHFQMKIVDSFKRALRDYLTKRLVKQPQLSK